MEDRSLKLEKLNESTEGESVIFVGPPEEVKHLVASLPIPTNSYGFVPEELDLKKLLELSEVFKNLISSEKLTRLTLVGVGWGGALVIHYAANNIKNVRRVLFVNAISRPKQLPLEKAFEWIERFLPLGLPFRPISKEFDPRPIIHRVRCPVLVVTESGSTNSIELTAHAKFLMERLPNAWQSEITENGFGEVFQSFIGVSTKQPQKASRGG